MPALISRRPGLAAVVVLTATGLLLPAPPVAGAPAPPRDLTASPSPGLVTLRWTHPDARKLEVFIVEEIDEDGSDREVSRLGRRARSVTLSGPAVRSRHRYRVVAQARDGSIAAPPPVRTRVPRRVVLAATVTARGGDGRLVGLRRKESNGGAVISRGRVRTPSVSPDARRVAYARWTSRRTGYDLYLGSPRRGSRTRLVGGRAEAYDPAWQGNGKRLAFTRYVRRPDGSFISTLAVIPIDGGDRSVVPHSRGLANPTWVRGGRALIAESGLRLVRIRVSTGDRSVVPGTRDGYAPVTSGNGQLAWVHSTLTADGNWRSELRRLRLPDGNRRTVLTRDGSLGSPAYTASDGKVVLEHDPTGPKVPRLLIVDLTDGSAKVWATHKHGLREPTWYAAPRR